MADPGDRRRGKRPGCPCLNPGPGDSKHMKAKPKVILIPLVCLALLAGCASQRDVIILDERLMILERQNRDLQQKNDSLQALLDTELERVGKTSQTSQTHLRSQFAGVSADLEALQQNMRVVGGRIDELAHALQRRNETSEAEARNNQAKLDELSLLTAKMNQRLEQIERFINLEGSARDSGARGSSGAAAGGARASAAGKENTADALYTAGKQAFDNGQMETARRQFEQLLKNFPTSPNADNAQFWIGESYYQEKWYEKAILEYQTVIEKFPKGNKVAAAMLKQGMAFLQLGDKSNAGLVWKELERRFPESNEAKVAAAKLKEL
jgi:tol-pal system protein YbgF